jgi:Tol biopolymer transport system component
MIMTTLIVAAAAATSQALPALSSNLNDYNLSTDAAGRTRVFARSEADFRNARILISERRGREWSEPRAISFSDGRFSDSDPWLTPDGRTLYFISTRPAPGRAEGRADYDIWRSSRIGRGWSEPEHLGPEINSPDQELGPELHSGVLYYASVRRGGSGGLDIYSARAVGGNFEPAAAMPAPINGPSSESDFTLSADGGTALFWRSDEGNRALIYQTRRDRNGWSIPEPLPEAVNVGPFNFTPSLSRDGRTLYFASTRERAGQAAGMADIYIVRLPRR